MKNKVNGEKRGFKRMILVRRQRTRCRRMRIRLIIRKNRGDRRISITRKEILGKKR
jgi:hypothetical protein